MTSNGRDNLRFLDAGIEAIETIAKQNISHWSGHGEKFRDIYTIASTLRARLRREAIAVERDVSTGRFTSGKQAK
jgi:hypothetical protein